jgi:hypothetical protein
VTQNGPEEPRDYRRLLDLVGGAVLTVLAAVVAVLALLIAILSHQVLANACNRATGSLTCNGPLLTAGFVFSVVGIVAAIGALASFQLRAYRRDSGLLVVPVLVMGATAAVLLVAVLLMRTAHPASVGALAAGALMPGTVFP